ncbi:MAG: ankyrin repeat domain-containing protein, partial [Rhodospirillales bacterium]
MGAATAAAQTPEPATPAATTPAAAPSASTIRLFKAVALNDMAAVKASIEDGADLEAENDDGMTPADLAVDRGHFIIAHYLLSSRLLSQTPPVALVPGKAEEAVTAAAKARPKRRFTAPPEKPSPPQPPAAPGAGEAREATAEGGPPATSAPTGPEPKPAAAEATKSPAASEPAETIAEVPAAEGAPPAPGEPALPPAAETPSPDRAEKPLAEEGVAEFFQSLVDLITPGGEKPPAVEEGAGPLPEEAIVEMTVEKPDEVVVEVTDGAAAPGEVIEELAAPAEVKLKDAELETVTAEDKPGPDAKGAEETAAAKPEESLLDRMAGLFTSDQKEEGAPGPGGAPGDAKAPPPEMAATPDAAPGAPPAAPPPTTAGDITAYELPLPPPQPDVARKFSPRFLDRLADFLESGDEEAFKAWLPEMQIMSADSGYIRQPLSPPAGPAPVPEKAPVAPVEEARLAAPEEPSQAA